ncbi:MAG: cupin domain-containing protein [Limisphaerales bacterium]
MVAPTHHRPHRGTILIEMVFALGVLAAVIIPVSLSFRSEIQLVRASCHQAVAMEIVDGEMEVLVAGEWQAFETGTHRFEPRAESAAILPPGRFWLTLGDGRLRLEWKPEGRHQGGMVSREVRIYP